MLLDILKDKIDDQYRKMPFLTATQIAKGFGVWWERQLSEQIREYKQADSESAEMLKTMMAI